MKWFLLVMGLCAGFFAFLFYERAVHVAEEKAREEALAQWRRDAQALMEEHARLAALRPMMAISKHMEPLTVEVQAPLDLLMPHDLVPVIELTKQRILDKRVRAEPERQIIFDRAAAFMDHLAALADSRTQALEALMKSRASASTMLSRPSPTTTGDFFNQKILKRWEDTVAQDRPVTARLMEDLRNAEREWNSRTDLGANVEQYDVSNFPPPVIPQGQISANSLASDVKPGAGTSARIWRRTYYYSYGYRFPSSAYAIP